MRLLAFKSQLPKLSSENEEQPNPSHTLKIPKSFSEPVSTARELRTFLQLIKLMGWQERLRRVKHRLPESNQEMLQDSGFWNLFGAVSLC